MIRDHALSSRLESLSEAPTPAAPDLAQAVIKTFTPVRADSLPAEIDPRRLFKKLIGYADCPMCHAPDAIPVRIFRNATSITTFVDVGKCPECGRHLRAQERDGVEAALVTRIIDSYEASDNGR